MVASLLPCTNNFEYSLLHFTIARGCSRCSPKLGHSYGGSRLSPIPNTWLFGPGVHVANGTSIGSAAFAGLVVVTNRHTDTETTLLLSTQFDKGECSVIQTLDYRQSTSVDITCDSQRSTDDFGQFITLSVRFCLQRDALR